MGDSLKTIVFFFFFYIYGFIIDKRIYLIWAYFIYQKSQ
jgi:hypothetical protein